MKEYTRKYPRFSLCGLNCGLCPRHHTDGTSRCPGCGGADFHLLHPSCAVITCSKKHGAPEYCFQCSSYPCERYAAPSEKDSFITYRNVLADMESARQDLDGYTARLDAKTAILEFLIANCNDGKKKNFYCLAVNLLPLDELEEIVGRIRKDIDSPDADPGDKARAAADLLEEAAAKRGITLKLRK